MKQFKNLLFLSLILLCWTLVSCKSSKTSSGWSLIWEENFNQEKEFRFTGLEQDSAREGRLE